ncbi:glutathione S-transferase family protein [Aquella oligotrophica]|uniref:Glutathione S-transferase n=1 Tax=Aquella oligotrophica TaxID=2067065 RepID=A0A2I7N8A0_9NEIS|nr:glutathione S-transferase family protein [Aquella oligotrophica]AUR52662.1 glutathione S-transferase [Aquella oligotrophica]
MSEFRLIIGNKHLSSWSLRAWLMIKRCKVKFSEIIVDLERQDVKAAILQLSPSGKVPALKHNDLLIWDSLSIGEYLAEVSPSAKLWPTDEAARAIARSVSNEMHSGFATLRKMMPFALFVQKDLPYSEELQGEIKRIEEIWLDCRSKFGQDGEFLFGDFSIADAMFAPVVLRFQTYGYKSDNRAVVDYCNAILAHPDLLEWLNSAKNN